VPTFRVRRVAGGGKNRTVEALGDYGGQILLVVVIIKVSMGRSSREPPAVRAAGMAESMGRAITD